MRSLKTTLKVGRVKAARRLFFHAGLLGKRLWKRVMQPTRTKNCAALCLDSSRLILAVSLIHREPEGEAVSFHYKYMSASKCGGPHRLGGGVFASAAPRLFQATCITNACRAPPSHQKKKTTVINRE